MFDLPLKFAWVPFTVNVLALIVWMRWSQRRRDAVLPVGARLILAALLLGLMACSGWLVRASSRFASGSVAPEESLAHGLVSRLDFDSPTTVSYREPDLHYIEGWPVLVLSPPARMEWELAQTVRRVEVIFGFDPAAFASGGSDGADFIVELTGKAYPRQILRTHLDPARERKDRRPYHVTLSLPPFEPGARLIVRTEPGPKGNNSWDWVYLSKLRLIEGKTYSAYQFPGFNRVPFHATGDTTWPISSPTGKPSLFVGTPTTLHFQLTGNERNLSINYGFMPGAYSNGGQTDGASLTIQLQSDSQSEKIFEYHAQPLQLAADRELLSHEIDLPPHPAGSTLIVSFLPGPSENISWDQIYIERFDLK